MGNTEMTNDCFEKEDEKQQYLDWRKLNPQGFVLNINTKKPKLSACINIIHKANGCSSLDTPPSLNRARPITPEHPKLCSKDIGELELKWKLKIYHINLEDFA
jgi:hypothetical protein